jgi:hypothetical protein
MKKTQVNRVELPVKDGKSMLMAWGDAHNGAFTCNKDAAKERLQYCLDNNIPLIGMGDYLEVGTRYSVGSGVYEQRLNPQEQLDEVVSWLRPLAERGLIIGLHEGNHENRATKEVGFNSVSVMCDILRVPYLGYSCYGYIMVGGKSYTMYSTHGAKNSATLVGKINAATNATSFANVDVVLYGHTHGLFHQAVPVEFIDRRNKSIATKLKTVVITGSFLEFRDSYGERAGYTPLEIGCPIIEFSASKQSIKVLY